MVSDSRFAPDDTVVRTSQKERADDRQTLRLLPLRDELNTIREIVSTTIRFVNIPRSERETRERRKR